MTASQRLNSEKSSANNNLSVRIRIGITLLPGARPSPGAASSAHSAIGNALLPRNPGSLKALCGIFCKAFGAFYMTELTPIGY